MINVFVFKGIDNMIIRYDICFSYYIFIQG